MKRARRRAGSDKTPLFSFFLSPPLTRPFPYSFFPPCKFIKHAKKADEIHCTLLEEDCAVEPFSVFLLHYSTSPFSFFILFFFFFFSSFLSYANTKSSSLSCIRRSKLQIRLKCFQTKCYSYTPRDYHR